MEYFAERLAVIEKVKTYAKENGGENIARHDLKFLDDEIEAIVSYLRANPVPKTIPTLKEGLVSLGLAAQVS